MNAWIAMALLAVAAILVVARPWLRARLPRVLRRRSANIVAYRTRVAEIEVDRDAGLLTDESARALKNEQSRRLLEEESGSATDEPAGGAARRGVGLALALLPVLLAVAWYIQVGSWRTEQLIAGGVPAGDNTATMQARIHDMVGRLTAELQAHPDNAQGWALLGRSQMVLHDYKASAQSYAQANRRSGNSNPGWLVAQGQSVAMANGRSLQGQAAHLFDEALKLAPEDPRALWYAGVAAAQRGDKARARALWQKLANQDVPADVRTALETQIKALGGDTANAPGDDKNAAPQTTPVKLRLQVRLAGDLKKRAPPDATLFVYAKATHGSPMPLAVRRIADPDLPMSLTLDDSMSVMPTAHLEDHDRWTVVARLSKSGTAAPAPGDLEGRITIDRAQAGKPATLVIDRIVGKPANP